MALRVAQGMVRAASHLIDEVVDISTNSSSARRSTAPRLGDLGRIQSISLLPRRQQLDRRQGRHQFLLQMAAQNCDVGAHRCTGTSRHSTMYILMLCTQYRCPVSVLVVQVFGPQIFLAEERTGEMEAAWMMPLPPAPGGNAARDISR